MTTPTDTPVWAGPARFMSPPDPMVRTDGSRHFSGVTYAVPGGYRPLQLDALVPATGKPAPVPAHLIPVPGADHIFLGCPDVDAIVRLSVDYLADNLLEKHS